MERRHFLSASALSTLSLPLLSSWISTPALANEKWSDNDDDYTKENGWETLVNSNGLVLKRKILLTQANGFVLDLNGKPVFDSSGNKIPDALKLQLIRFSKNFPVGRHAHPEGELTYVLAGSFYQMVDGQAQADEYKVGDSIYMPAHTVHPPARVGAVGTTIISFTPRNVIAIK